MTRYTHSELKALSELLLRSKEVLSTKTNLFLAKKDFWIQISEFLHNNGWPKRPWVRLRKYGIRILAGMSPSDLRTKNRNRLLSMENSYGIEQVQDLNVIKNNRPILYSSNNSAAAHKNLPPLLSSSEASASNLISASNWINSPHKVNAGPQILHIFSTASSASNPESVACVNHNDPNKTNGVLPSVRLMDAHIDNGTIDLSVSSDEDANTDPYLANPPKRSLTSTNASSSTRENPEQVKLIEEEIRKRIEICDIKLDILQLKKEYWMDKLNKFRNSHKS